MPDELLTVKEVAAHLRVGLTKVYELIATRQLGSVRIPGPGSRPTLRVGRRHLDAFERRAEVPAKGQAAPRPRPAQSIDERRAKWENYGRKGGGA